MAMSSLYNTQNLNDKSNTGSIFKNNYFEISNSKHKKSKKKKSLVLTPNVKKCRILLPDS